MPLSTSTLRVRSLIGDMNKAAVQEMIANGDAVTRLFQYDMYPVRTGTISVFVSGRSITTFTGNIAAGVLDFSGSTMSGLLAPTAGAQIIASYLYNALSDDEIESFVNGASGAGEIMAASLAAAGLAGNYARFFAYTQGSQSVDKDRLSDKLMRLSEILSKRAMDSLALGTATLTIARPDDSGTEFDGYDTATASRFSGTS